MGDQARRFPYAPRANCRRCATRRTSSPLCARRAWADSSCSTCTIFPAKARRWWGVGPVLGRQRLRHRGGVSAASATTVPLARLGQTGLYDRGERLEAGSRNGPFRPRAIGADAGRRPGAARTPAGKSLSRRPFPAATLCQPAADGLGDWPCRWPGTHRLVQARSWWTSLPPGHAFSKTIGTSGSIRRRYHGARRRAVDVCTGPTRLANRRLNYQRNASCCSPPPECIAAISLAGAAGIFQHLLEHGLDPSAGAAHAGHPLRPEASGPGRVSHRLPQQLAMVGLVSRAGAMILDDLPKTCGRRCSR